MAKQIKTRDDDHRQIVLKIEQFVDDHRPLVLICLAIFILIVYYLL
ncbi:hypothetical protein [Streptococcus equi]|nr:hypothetical protein [Streptococcus equi]MCD3368918.1 hypothetical protein [Streptococcus equi subsp. zooepidemicus]